MIFYPFDITKICTFWRQRCRRQSFVIELFSLFTITCGIAVTNHSPQCYCIHEKGKHNWFQSSEYRNFSLYSPMHLLQRFLPCSVLILVFICNWMLLNLKFERPNFGVEYRLRLHKMIFLLVSIIFVLFSLCKQVPRGNFY